MFFARNTTLPEKGKNKGGCIKSLLYLCLSKKELKVNHSCIFFLTDGEKR